MPITHTKRGEITRYGLACGYIQRHVEKTGTVTLSMENQTIMLRGKDRYGRIFHAFSQDATMETIRNSLWIVRHYMKRGYQLWHTWYID